MLSAHRADDRQWDRISVAMQVTLFATTDAVGRDVHALDLSWNGTRVRGDRLVLRPGQSVEVVFLEGKTMHRRPARVVWAERDDQELEAGLQFVGPLAG